MNRYSCIIPGLDPRRASLLVRLSCAAVVVALGFAARCAAQTNAPAGFQGFNPGDMVRVRVEKPPIDLARAYFHSQTASNIVVVSKGDRYCLEKSAVTLSPSEQRTTYEAAAAAGPGQPPPGASTLPAGPVPSAQVNAGMDLLTTMKAVEEHVLGNYRNDPGYGKASQYYEETMQGVLSGQVSLEALVTKAEETLKKLDEFQDERAKDPQFEGFISQLRSFVDRAHRGERIVWSADKIP
jgi:hypothetical protein